MRLPNGYEKFRSSLAKCSYGGDPGKSLVDSEEDVVNFDAVKQDYVIHFLKRRHLSPCSADALFMDKDNNYVFVEFKSGDVKPKELVKKMYHTALIFLDKDQVPPKWLRENAIFVLITSYSDGRRKLAKEGFRKSSVNFRAYIPDDIEGFLYKQTLVMSPEDFTNIYCGAS